MRRLVAGIAVLFVFGCPETTPVPPPDTLAPFQKLATGDEWLYSTTRVRTVELPQGKEDAKQLESVRERVLGPGEGLPEGVVRVERRVEADSKRVEDRVRTEVLGWSRSAKGLYLHAQWRTGLDGSRVDYEPPLRMVALPLEKGTSWKVGKLDTGPYSVELEGEDLGPETLKILAGTFDRARHIRRSGTVTGFVVLGGQRHPVEDGRHVENAWYDDDLTLLESKGTRTLTIRLRDGNTARLTETWVRRLKPVYAARSSG